MAAGMVDAFTDEKTTEEDIGGYYYDISFVLESLTSKAFRLVALFIAVLGGVFYFLYQGGVGRTKRDFLSRLTENVAPPTSTSSPFDTSPASRESSSHSRCPNSPNPSVNSRPPVDR